ncbi:GTP-binding protein [Candidatus Woesearchaeota archaeon]|nr:GTP-binding protein [Candidatus Woesearchaeota archaeon]
MKKTPISIISGYLGSGKTTLLRNIGGCVCCSLTGEFELAVKELIKKYKPDLIVVETTGVAEPDALIFDIEDSFPELVLDSIIVLVDSDAFLKYPLGKVGITQVELADIILLNKTDLVDKNKLNEIEKKLQIINKKANIIRTSYSKISNNMLFGLYSKKSLKKISHPHLLETEVFSFETNKTFNKEKFENFVKKLPKEIYRAKGFVKLNNKFYLFNYVAERYSLEEFKADKTEIVFIGEDILKYKQKILKELNSLVRKKS